MKKLFLLLALLCCVNSYANKSLDEFLSNYQRPFIILDLFSQNDTNLFDIAKKNDCVCVILNESPDLLNKCRDECLENVVLLQSELSEEELLKLSDCEHFDVTLISQIDNFIKDFSINKLRALIAMGDFLIFELDVEKKAKVELFKQFLKTHFENIVKISTVEDELLIVETLNPFLQRKTWLRETLNEKLYAIDSTFSKKWLHKPVSWKGDEFELVDWIPGINLCTFKMCRGVYPEPSQLEDCLKLIQGIEHTDWMINNMIVQGTSLAMIDAGDDLSKRFFSERLLKAHEMILTINDPKKVEHFFWNVLVKEPVTTEKKLKLFDKLVDEPARIINFGKTGTVHSPFETSFAKFWIDCEDDLNIFQSQVETLDTYEDYTILHVHPEPGNLCEVISSITKKPSMLVFGFDYSSQKDLADSLAYINDLGFKDVNFSIRDLPSLFLETNRYTKVQKQWVSNLSDLKTELDQCYELDYDPANFWGFVYVRF